MADIVLKDRNGNDVTYEGIETVTFDTPTEGQQAVFTEGVAVEGLEIVPDFSGGDMSVNAPAGTLVKSAIIRKPVTEEFIVGESEGAIALAFVDDRLEVTPSSPDKFISKVTIEKPEALIPENIAEGIDIGGVVGTLAGGGAKVAFGVFEATNGVKLAVEHNLGIVPDFIILEIMPSGSILSGKTATAFGLSTALYNYFANLGGANKPNIQTGYTSTARSNYSSGTYLDVTTGGAVINTVDETKFQTPNGLQSSMYYWIAVGGLF